MKVPPYGEARLRFGGTARADLEFCALEAPEPVHDDSARSKRPRSADRRFLDTGRLGPRRSLSQKNSGELP
jgi:hypothetical protein